jgi:hypothetical protein
MDRKVGEFRCSLDDPYTSGGLDPCIDPTLHIGKRPNGCSSVDRTRRGRHGRRL